jgi:DNA-binding LacI/PurR family transcriptional regulator
MICEMLTSKNIPVVLIDRDIVAFPGRSRYDLVGIDNYHACYEVTSHLVSKECRSLFFLHRPHSAPTIDLRILGFRGALADAGIPLSKQVVIESEPDIAENLAPLLKAEGPAGIVCANDATAAVLLHTLRDMGMHVPSRVRVASFDDIRYARHLQVPLTTYRQPTDDIGTAALETLLMRMRNPGMAPLTILLKGTLIQRESSAL